MLSKVMYSFLAAVFGMMVAIQPPPQLKVVPPGVPQPMPAVQRVESFDEALQKYAEINAANSLARQAQEKADVKTVARQERATGIKLKSAAAPIVEAQNVIDLRAAIAKGGKVTVPAGRYILERPLILSGLTSFIGAYRDWVTIDGSQMTDPTLPIMMIDRVWGFEVSNFTITGNRALNSIGILNSTNTPNANGSYGTCSGSAIFSHIIISNCKKGLVVGDGSKYVAASENVYTQLEVIMCDRCIELNDYNTLDHLFFMLCMGACNEGMVINGASHISVYGGSLSAIKGFAFVAGHCSALSLNDVRMEEGNGFVMIGGACTLMSACLKNCLIHQRANLAQENTTQWTNGWKSPIIAGGSSKVRVESCFISMTAGRLYANGPHWPPIMDAHNCAGGYINANGNHTTVDPSASPFVNAHSQPGVKVRAYDNMWADAGEVFKGWHADIAPLAW